MLRRLLLLPLLAPLLAALLLAALNPRPAVSLRLLTWRSPVLPLGLWIGAAAAGGALLSGTAAALALQEGRPGLRRQVRRSGRTAATGPAADSWEFREPARRAERAPDPMAAPPERSTGEPAPTVEVPFRVIRRGGGAAATATRQAEAVAVPVGDGWEEGSGEDW